MLLLGLGGYSTSAVLLQRPEQDCINPSVAKISEFNFFPEDYRSTISERASTAPGAQVGRLSNSRAPPLTAARTPRCALHPSCKQKHKHKQHKQHTHTRALAGHRRRRLRHQVLRHLQGRPRQALRQEVRPVPVRHARPHRAAQGGGGGGRAGDAVVRDPPLLRGGDRHDGQRVPGGLGVEREWWWWRRWLCLLVVAVVAVVVASVASVCSAATTNTKKLYSPKLSNPNTTQNSRSST